MKKNSQLNKRMLLREFCACHTGKSRTGRYYEEQIEKLSKFRYSVRLEDITERFIVDYYNYMINVMNNSEKTADRSLRILKTLVNKALYSGYMETNPFRHIYIKDVSVRKDRYIPR
jgi:hypothetical protein